MLERLRVLLNDARYAGRLLVKSPGYSAVVILVLSLGIGTNLLTFGLFQAFALTPLGGVRDATALQFLSAQTNSGRDVALSYLDYEYVRDHARAYETLAGSYVQGWTLGRGPTATVVFGEFVTGNYFDVLGVDVPHGRALAPADNIGRREHPVAVISDALWRGRLGGDPRVLGRTIELNRTSFTVIGVAAPEFHGSVAGLATDVFVPYMMQPALDGGADRLNDPRLAWVFAFGRLRNGVSPAAADAEAASLGRELASLRPADGFSRRVAATSIWQAPQGAQVYMLPAVSLLSAMSIILLLVVCANVAGLVLVRGLTRRGEITTRLALGAGRGRVIRLLVFETALLALPGGVIGYYLPLLAIPFLSAAQPIAVPFPLYFNAGGSPMLVAAAFTVAAAVVLAGVAPAFKASAVSLASSLKADASRHGRSRNDVRAVLVVAQVALSLVLLVATALVTRSVTHARHADAGFDRDVASATVDPGAADYDQARAAIFYDRLLQSLRSDPAIRSASLMKDPLLMLVDLNAQEFVPEGYARRRNDDLSFLFNVVSDDHFQTLEIPLRAGRDFNERDTRDAPHVAIVNDSFARRFWGTPGAAIGQRLQTRAWASDRPDIRTIVGVVRDIKYARLTEAPRPYVYLPHSQAFNFMMSVQARGTGTPAATLDALRRHLHELDPELPVMQAATLEDLTSLGVGIYDVTARALAIIGVVATLLMALGIFGLVAYTVQQRTREIGVRVAVGAAPHHILRTFARQGVVLAGTGAALGIAGALTLTQFMSALLYRVSATDFLSFAAASIAVMVTALAASILPAWRGSRVDPLVALRHE
jgi:predicted permease